MIFLAIFVFNFVTVQLLIAIFNLIFENRSYQSFSGNQELISVMIPARNEETNIGNLLNDLRNQTCENIEILVYDDHSTDNTNSVIRSQMEVDSRVRLIAPVNLPEGWLGKTYACYCMSQQAKGEFFLFIDSDVRIANKSIANYLNYAKRHKLALLSVFPQQIMLSRGEWLTIPIMNYILLSLLPLILVRKTSFSSLAAANGQFMLFDKKNYQQFQPHLVMKMSKVEDIDIARFYKINNLTMGCLAESSQISCRMYRNFDEAVNGFSKNVLNFFGNSKIVAILFWLTSTAGFFPIWISFSFKGFLVYLLIIMSIRICISITSGQNIFKNLIFHFPQQFSLGLFIYKAIFNKQTIWKGRNIS